MACRARCGSRAKPLSARRQIRTFGQSMRQLSNLVQNNVAVNADDSDASLAVLRTTWLIFMLSHSIVAISIVHGSLANAEYALMIGAFAGEQLTGTERFIDRQFDGAHDVVLVEAHERVGRSHAAVRGVENFTGGVMTVKFKLIGGESDQIAGLVGGLGGTGGGSDGRTVGDVARGGLAATRVEEEMHRSAAVAACNLELLRREGFVANHKLVTKEDWTVNPDGMVAEIEREFSYPIIAKPSDDGCSSAVKKIKNREELVAYAKIMFGYESKEDSESARVLKLRYKEEFPQKNYFMVEDIIQADGAEHFLDAGVRLVGGEDPTLVDAALAAGNRCQPRRLDVWLHGRDNVLTELKFIADRQRAPGVAQVDGQQRTTPGVRNA